MAALVLEHAQDTPRSRFDHLELETRLECSQEALLDFARTGVLDLDKFVATREVPDFLVPRTPLHVEKILQILEWLRKDLADLNEQHKRRAKDKAAIIDLIEAEVLPLCVPVVMEARPKKPNGLPKQQHYEGDFKRLQLRTSKERVKLEKPEDVFRAMEAWERELAQIEARFDALPDFVEDRDERQRLAGIIANPDESESYKEDLLHELAEIDARLDERRRLGERMVLLEPDLNALIDAVRLTITTKEVFQGYEEIGLAFPDSLPRVECGEDEDPAMPYRVISVVTEEYLGAAAWRVLGEHPEPAEGEEYSKTLEATAVESFVANHPPLIEREIDKATGETVETERPFELMGVVRISAKTTLHCG